MPPRIWSFQSFELDAGRYELLRNGKAVRVERIPMELLILLVSREGQLVGRQEMVERLWGPGVHLDSEQGINTAIRKLRQVLRDDSDNPKFIQTVVGKGYRFCAAVTVQQPSPEPEALLAEPVEIPAPAVRAPRGWKLWVGALAAGLALAAAGSWVYLGSSREPVAIAVLPFENLTGSPESNTSPMA